MEGAHHSFGYALILYTGCPLWAAVFLTLTIKHVIIRFGSVKRFQGNEAFSRLPANDKIKTTVTLTVVFLCVSKFWRCMLFDAWLFVMGCMGFTLLCFL